jgi:hypothetical protein
MSVHCEALLPETMYDLIDHDLVADFIEALGQFPDTDWRIGYRYYKKLCRQGAVFHPQWRMLFRLLKNYQS